MLQVLDYDWAEIYLLQLTTLQADKVSASYFFLISWISCNSSVHYGIILKFPKKQARMEMKFRCSLGYNLDLF